MKLLKVLFLSFVPMALCSLVPRDTAANTIESKQKFVAAMQEFTDTNGESSKEAQVIASATKYLDSLIAQYVEQNNIENGPNSYEGLKQMVNDYGPTDSRSYAKQIMDLFRDSFIEMISSNPRFLESLFVPTAENLRQFITTILTGLGKPVSPNP